jgi:hypothetical protein
MDVWGKFEALSPLQRIIVTFSVTAVLIVAVYLADRWARKKRAADLGAFASASLVEQRADGTLVAYIAFWRYVFFGLFFATGFCICIYILVRLCLELPLGFWKHWDSASAPAIILVLAIAMPLFAYGVLKGGYKKVQLEISKYSVRYLRGAARGGILLSDNYVSVPLKDIISVSLRGNLLGGGVIDARTPTQVHSIILLLPQQEQELCLGILNEAISKARADRTGE